MTQQTIPCVVYRGGTSRGLFFHESDLPRNIEQRNQVFIQGIGSLDASHVDGLGGGTSHTSKVVIVNKSERTGIDVNFTFVQLGMGSDVVDYEGTCGNLMAAVGAFAVDEGLIPVTSEMTNVIINVWSTNINKIIIINVPLLNKKARVSGDFVMSGVSGRGAKYSVNIEQPSGGKTGQVLPLSTQSAYELNENHINYTFSDIVNPFIYVNAKDFSISGIESNEEVAKNSPFLHKLEQIREHANVKSGLAKTIEQAREKFIAIPKISYLSKPQDYMTSTGVKIKKENYDILARMISVKNIHRSFAVSGLLNLAATCLLSGTIPNEICNLKATGEEQIIRIGHPEGIATVRVKIDHEKQEVIYVGLDRTVRRIMSGNLYVSID